MDPAATPGSEVAPGAQPAWHENIITKDAAGVESLAPPASWLDKAPGPLRDWIGQQMHAARQKTDGTFKVPGDDAKPEDWEPIWKALGRPDDPDGYGIAKPEKMPDGLDWNDDFAKKFTAHAHSIGMPKAMAHKLMEWHTAQMGEQAAAMRAAGEKYVADEREALTKTFGPKLADAAAAAQNAAKEAGIDPDLFNPAAGKFAGVDTLKIVSGLLGKLVNFTQEGNFAAGGGSSPTASGKAYAEAVIGGKHPDSPKYYGDPSKGVRADPDFQKKVSAMFDAAA